MKTCPQCRNLLPEANFHRHPTTADRLQPKCKACVKEWNATYYAKRAPLLRAYARQQSALPHRKQGRLDAALRSATKYPDRRLANATVRNALRDGRIHRQPCWVCGEKAQAHHASYARDAWLLVSWLCPLHHRAAHRLVES